MLAGAPYADVRSLCWLLLACIGDRRGDQFSHASDIWSMGLVVGECAQHRHMLPPTHGFWEVFLLVA
jgi:hypothetical protein